MLLPKVLLLACLGVPASCRLMDSFQDPKNVLVKDDSLSPEKQNDPSSTEPQQWGYPMTNVNLPRPINILSLGGSGSWGATLDDRNGAYPWLVGSPNVDHVDNLATSEMGAYFSAMCLESIILDSTMKNYDVILLDFVSSELEGFSWLLQRLRKKYPEAVIIYIHIWPLKPFIKSADGLTPDTLGLDPDIDWRWSHAEDLKHKFHPQEGGGTRPAVRKVGGYYTHLRWPTSPKEAMELFSDDWWNLSAAGHVAVANDVLKILSGLQDDVFKPKMPVFFATSGEQCYTWIDTGKTKLAYSDFIMTRESGKYAGDAWFLQMNPEHPENTGEIKFDSQFSNAVPIVLAYISNRELESVYSSVEVNVNGKHKVMINPNHFYTTKGVKYAIVGHAEPGENVLNFETTDSLNMPFRLVGVFVNGDVDKSTKIPTLVEEDKSSGHHVIYCFMQPDPRYSDFKVNYDVVESIISITVERLSPHWNVHVITNWDEAIARLSRHKLLQVMDYRETFFSHRLARFNRGYIHQSSNDIEYEKFCIYRWIIISEYVQYLQSRGVFLNHIITADSDLAVLENPFNVDRTVFWNSIESYKIIDGGAIMWSLPGLASYSNFLSEIYATKENAIEMVTKYGFISPCREDRSLLIPCFMEGEKSVMWHVSDMNWYNLFASQRPEFRFNKVSFECGVIGIFDGAEYNFFRVGSDIKYNDTATDKSLCVVHFNGSAKLFAIPFGEFIHGKDLLFSIDRRPKT